MSLEDYITALINERKADIDELYRNRSDYTQRDFEILFNRYSASISDMMMCLTSHSNPLNRFEKWKESLRKSNSTKQ